MSSSPLRYPSSDQPEMDLDPPGNGGNNTTDNVQGETLPDAPERVDQPLFLGATPSPIRPARTTQNFNAGGLFSSSPTKNITARRALGLPITRGGLDFNSSPLAVSDIPSPCRPDTTPAVRSRHTQLEGTPRTPRGSEGGLFIPATTPRSGRTRRGDIHSSLPFESPTLVNRRTAPPPASLNVATSDNIVPDSSLPSAPPEPATFNAIWGTNVSIMDTANSFVDFLRNFKPKWRYSYDTQNKLPPSRTLSADPNAPLYPEYLKKMRLTGDTGLNLDVVNLLAYPPAEKLWWQLQKYPQEVIPSMDQALKDLMVMLAEEDGEREEVVMGVEQAVYKVRPLGYNAINMRDLNPSSTDQIIVVKGLVIRGTPIIPDMREAFFKCIKCAHTHRADIDRGRIAEPAACTREQCGEPGGMVLIHNRSDYANRQVIRLQETPDVVPDGQTPHTISLCVYDELVDIVKPGDRVTVTGIFRAVPVRVNARTRTVKSLFKTFVDVLHMQRGSGGRLGFDKTTRLPGERIPGVGIGGTDYENEDDELPLAEDEEGGSSARLVLEKKLKDLSERPDIYDYLSRSLAPSIWGMDDVKKGLLLQLFGGTNKNISRGGGGDGPRYRGDINVLLVGDPGTSKSQMLMYVHRIAPRGVFTSGKGSSAVGLTAYVTRDPDSKQLVLESGALVLSDGGVCCIDEFDKMSDSTRSVLHEVMEQQTVSIAKAGIITTLNARTSILAAANPIGSKYNPDWPLTRNVDLPPTLISRFDLFYLVVDKVDEDADRRLAQHLVGLYLEDAPPSADQDVLDIETLSAYITYGRTKIHPVITEEASRELVSCYVDLRKLGETPGSKERRVTATTRQLESLIRLSEAHARMRYSSEVQVQDVQEANRLMRDAIRTSATDPTTGLIDLDYINIGAGLQQRKMRGDLKKELLDVIEKGGNAGVKWSDALKSINAQSTVVVDVNEFTEVVRGLEAEGVVKVVGDHQRRVIRKIQTE